MRYIGKDDEIVVKNIAILWLLWYNNFNHCDDIRFHELGECFMIKLKKNILTIVDILMCLIIGELFFIIVFLNYRFQELYFVFWLYPLLWLIFFCINIRILLATIVIDDKSICCMYFGKRQEMCYWEDIEKIEKSRSWGSRSVKFILKNGKIIEFQITRNIRLKFLQVCPKQELNNFFIQATKIL